MQWRSPTRSGRGCRRSSRPAYATGRRRGWSSRIPSVPGFSSTNTPSEPKGETMNRFKLTVAAALVMAAFAVHAKPPAVDPAMVAARTHFFGADNVDQKSGKVVPQKVIISYFSVQSFAVAAKG